MKLYYETMESPIGPLTITVDKKCGVRIDYGTPAHLEKSWKKWADRYLHAARFVHQPDCAQQVTDELTDYFHGSRRYFPLAIPLYRTPFQRHVWEALVDTIPFGDTTSYKSIAIAIGNAQAVRAVGGAVNKNPLSIVVPCHRVIGANGKMVGYNGGLDKKIYLLKHEKKICAEMLQK